MPKGVSPSLNRPNRAVRLPAQPNIREVNWERDAAGNVPAAVKDRLLAVSMEHTDIRRQLDVLRKTRGQRDVGALKVPAALQAGIPMSDSGVKARAQIQDVAPAEE